MYTVPVNKSILNFRIGQSSILKQKFRKTMRVYPQVVQVTSIVGQVVILLIIGTIVSGTLGKPSVR